MVKPGYYRHEFKEGEDYGVVLDLEQPDGTVFDVTGYTGISQIWTIDDVLAASFVVNVATSNQVELLLADGGGLTSRRYLWDLKLFSPDTSGNFWLEGDVIVSKAYSRVQA